MVMDIVLLEMLLYLLKVQLLLNFLKNIIYLLMKFQL